jgi:molybdopterin/thiamine biosynthesis adenylyltransferase
LARWLVNRRCLAAGVEWIDGGTGERHGQVARYGPSGGACFECTMTTKTFERLEKRYRCGFRDDDPAAGVPMPSTATLSSTIAAIQVQEALHVAMGVEAPAGLNLGQRLWVYLRPYQMFVDDLPTRADCLAHPDGLPEASVQMQAPWGTTTLDDVVQAARVIDRTADRVDLGYEVVVNTTCPLCGHESGYAGRRDRLAVASMQCPECGAARRYAGTSVIWAGDALASRPLGDLSIPPREWLSVRGEGDATTVVEVGAAT